MKLKIGPSIYYIAKELLRYQDKVDSSCNLILELEYAMGFLVIFKKYLFRLVLTILLSSDYIHSNW